MIYSTEKQVLFLLSLALISLALVTDLLDGYLARKLGVVSTGGYLLDGLGDRAVYIALILTFYGQQELWGIVAWLLILREVAIYAIRVVEADWRLKLHSTRSLSLLHAFCLRLWFGLMLTEDALGFFESIPKIEGVGANVMSVVLLTSTLLIGYASILMTITTPTTAEGSK